ncbi:MAG: hypothetical protein WCT47_13160 [Betaproteobacteria bacterium]
MPKVAIAMALAAGLATTMVPARALDFGPFSLTGFAKFEVQQASNQCVDCQRVLGEDRHRQWADDLMPGRPYGTETNHVTLFQPWLSARFDLGKGFKLTGLLSQRLRDGKVDIPGFLYERNFAISHEDWGRLAVGAWTTRAWSLADYPFGTTLGVADAWASSGAGYGLNTKAVRYTSRPFDVLAGDLVLEATYDQGNTAFKRNKPKFVEVFAQYRKGDLLVEAILQDTRNGNAQAWGHGPFTGLTPFPADDDKLGGSGQSIAMIMARYPINNRLEVLAGARRNRWSGAYAVVTGWDAAGGFALWNNMFNVDWGGALNGVTNPGYAATSTDVTGGLRYRQGDWSATAGLLHLGHAKTANPSDRGQHNSATIATVGLGRDWRNGVQTYLMAGTVEFGRMGLAPLSMPAHTAFTGVDPRVTRRGNWFGAGAVYVF